MGLSGNFLASMTFHIISWSVTVEYHHYIPEKIEVDLFLEYEKTVAIAYFSSFITIHLNIIFEPEKIYYFIAC